MFFTPFFGRISEVKFGILLKTRVLEKSTTSGSLLKQRTGLEGWKLDLRVEMLAVALVRCLGVGTQNGDTQLFSLEGVFL